MYADLAIQSARASMASFTKGAGGDMDQFMVNGVTREEEKDYSNQNQQQYKLE